MGIRIGRIVSLAIPAGRDCHGSRERALSQLRLQASLKQTRLTPHFRSDERATELREVISGISDDCAVLVVPFAVIENG